MARAYTLQSSGTQTHKQAQASGTGVHSSGTQTNQPTKTAHASGTGIVFRNSNQPTKTAQASGRDVHSSGTRTNQPIKTAHTCLNPQDVYSSGCWSTFSNSSQRPVGLFWKNHSPLPLDKCRLVLEESLSPPT